MSSLAVKDILNDDSQQDWRDMAEFLLSLLMIIWSLVHSAGMPNLSTDDLVLYWRERNGRKQWHLSLCVIFQDLRRLFRGRLQNSAVEMKRTKSPFFTGVRKQALLLSGQYYMGNGKSNTAVREAAASLNWPLRGIYFLEGNFPPFFSGWLLPTVF